MNQRLAKKIRQANRRAWKEYFKAIKELPFTKRWGIAWYILFGKKEKK